VFWSDWNRESPKLEWANADGTGRSVFLKGAAVKLPNSLSIDYDRDELCWADAGTKSIGKKLHYPNEIAHIPQCCNPPSSVSHAFLSEMMIIS
jgi:nidogen (entactin)